MVRVGTVVRTLILCGLALTTLAFAKTDKSKTIVTYPSAFAVSQPVSDLPIDESMFATREMPEPRPVPHAAAAPGLPEDPVLQKEGGPFVSATPGVDFDGVPAQNYAPSDSNMAVGPNHIVETVNVRFAIYSKTGTLLSGPTNFTTFFTPLGGNCAAGASDPIVNYDRLADRWVISDVGIGGSYSECVAVSKTNDPTGAYVLYAYGFGVNLNDYPKLGVWPTTSNAAYLATYNIFGPGGFAGADICGFDRTKMLAGAPSPAQLCKMTPNTEGGYLPSDMDGPTAPTDGTPGVFISWQNSNPGQLYLRKLTLNFAGGTATLSAPTTISVANFVQACGGCVPQTGTFQTLDTLSDRVMYRFAVRHFADHDRAVVNHAVQTGTGSQVAVRWYELYDPAGAVTVNQQGTFAPDTTYRWMASIAEDKNGDIGLGYSASSSSIHPGIRFTGRVPTDASGTLETEASILVGTGSQTSGLARWGDYTAMQVDPSDDCTFWYVDQYEKVSGTFNWNTNIGSFAFTGCTGGGPSFTLTAVPNTVTISQGSSGTSTITVVPAGGFTGSVTLSASGLPSGVTAAFVPNPTTTTSVLTLTASATAATGTSTVTITGTSGSLTATTTISLTVTQGGGPVVTLTPTSLVFGKIVVGTTSTGKNVTLANTGNATLIIASITTSGDFAQVTSTKPCGATLAAGAHCIIRVTFTPTQLGLRTGNITITDNAANSPQTVPLSGTGVLPVTLTPSSATYAAQAVGTTSLPKTFTLKNNQTVTLNSIVISTTGDFSVSATTCTTSLAAKTNCTIKVVFKPTATGTRTGTLNVADNASNSPQTSSLTGTGK
jgi:Abnormal spindle-like microcephaly-assoc'd, ASPM-SPD-2-Hydin